jgi:hypothetical protein
VHGGKRVSEWYVRNIAADDRFTHSAVGGNTAMKAAASLLVAGLMWAGVAQGQQAMTVQMQCRNLSGSGNFMAAGESYVNGMACHPVASPAVDAGAQSAEPTTVAQTQPYAGVSYAYASAPSLAVASLRTPVAMGPSVYIEPMQGLDGYLSAAFERKHVGLAPVISDGHATYVLHLYWGDASASDKRANRAPEGTPTLQLIERSSGTVVFAYPLNRANTWHGEKVTAETFAGQVKELVAKR